MPNPAATTDESAPSTQSSAQSIEDALHSGFLPDDPHYRQTGKFAAEKTEKPEAARSEDQQEQDPEQHSATPSERGDDTAAASKAATEEKDPSQRGRGENRWQKLSRENRELRERLARIEGREEARKEAGSQGKGETHQASQPGAEKSGAEAKAAKRPQIDDLDDKGKAKYATLKDYNDAVDKWHDERTLGMTREEIAKADKARADADNERIIAQEVKRRYDAVVKEHPDYVEKCNRVFGLKDEHGQEEFFYAKGSHLDGFFLDSERGHDVMNALFSDWDHHKAIFARNAKGQYLMNPLRQLRELTRLELALPAKAKSGPASETTTPSPKPVTRASRPPQQTSGQGTVAKDAVEQAIADNDFETYRKAANERDPRIRSLRK